MSAEDLERAERLDPFAKLADCVRNNIVCARRAIREADTRLSRIEQELQAQMDAARLASKAALLDPAGTYKVREDPAGSGWFQATRANAGGKYTHKGLDTLCTPGEAVVAPEDALVERWGKCYVKPPQFDLIVLWVWDTLRVKILYVEPRTAVGSRVRRGQVIGVAQDVTERKDYRARGMLPHIHTEIWVAGRPVNPANYMGISA